MSLAPILRAPLSLGLVLLVAIPSALMAQGDGRTPATPYVGKVLISGAAALGGAGRQHWPLARFGRGDLVEVLEHQGPYVRIRMPAEASVWLAMRTLSERPQVYIKPNPRGGFTVFADSLTVRPRYPKTADIHADYPFIGKIGRGTNLIGLEQRTRESGGRFEWLRVVPPESLSAYMLAETIGLAADQAAARARFDASFAQERAALVRASTLARGASPSDSGSAERATVPTAPAGGSPAMRRADEALGAMSELSKPGLSTQRLGSIEAELRASAKALQPGDPRRARIETALLTLDRQKSILRASERHRATIADAERRLAETRATELRRLEAAAEARRKRAEQVGQGGSKDSRIVTSGYLRRQARIPGVDRPGPGHYLEMGGERRAWIQSDRYDLNRYVGKLVGVIEVRGEGVRRPGDAVKTYRVRRLEIISH